MVPWISVIPSSSNRSRLARQDSMPFENREMLNEAWDSIGQLYRAWGRPVPAI
jgi:hypothetical protein